MELLNIELLADKKIIVETLSRIGIANLEKKIIYPSCYLYEENDYFYIAHFKQLFSILRDDSYNNISDEDITRRNAICFCLRNWGLIDVDLEFIEPYNMSVFVLPFKEKYDWFISHKINMKLLNNK
jgi:hypothetical protein